ncbi:MULTISPECIES: hypothetical protein [Pseudomonas]|uniref:hypothetical protein n=1 Tax=Pseudomonas TaxID=286 RepID=UPI0000394F37|nr:MULTISPECIES: hypothetical protein [Pseudomonas]MCH5487034.1 hypothetical protein [Pseudomonas syringae pv. syringae]MCH5549964.1 hypothetical protein [Pseudomonas syringae pv. syringae]MDO1458189.1 hypothetical protein [Pseudomonas syringae pv. syringae]QGG76811.1 hypothetical protein N028_16160 [Pseudomonas syringae USA011]BBN64035.1 hypothetical protein KUIN1_32250 [Pseudomonas sp. KUIN-1]
MKTPTSGVTAKRSATPSFWIRTLERFLTVVALSLCVRHKDAQLFCIPGATGIRLTR